MAEDRGSPGAAPRAAVASAFALTAEDRVIARRRNRLMAKLLAGVAGVMGVPPLVAGVFGGLGLAVVVGILSIFAGLAGMVVVVYRWEHVQRRADVTLPAARLLR